jgi:two-component system cell cycle response regulator
MKVLIAEDEPVSRMILHRAIVKSGHECLVAKDGIEAWQLFQEVEIDTIISDWMMPGIDGIELCRRVRQDARPGYTYFIFLTALGDKAHLLTGIEAGADDYLTKPLDRDELKVRLISASRVAALHGQLAQQRGELERLNKELFVQARTDSLTQLANRLKLREDFEVLRSRVERYGHKYCAVMCDIDFFKLYNDNYGHIAGDQVLQAVAKTIVKECRSGDQVYRYGGEEFLIIMPEQTIETAMLGAERINRAVEGLKIPHLANRLQGIVTLSLGVAVLGSVGERSVDALLNSADAALYRAKELGRNRVENSGATALA